MAATEEVLAAHADLRSGPLNENVRQAGREPVPAAYSPHQLLTGGGIPTGGEFRDPSLVHGPTPGQAPAGPVVEHFPIGESDAHAGTYTLGREDA